MKSKLFTRKGKEYDFKGNRETGKWGMVKNNGDLSFLEKGISNPNEFIGTSLAVLNITRNCNLDCFYCHVGSLKNEDRMPFEISKTIIDNVMDLLTIRVS